MLLESRKRAVNRNKDELRAAKKSSATGRILSPRKGVCALDRTFSKQRSLMLNEIAKAPETMGEVGMLHCWPCPLQTEASHLPALGWRKTVGLIENAALFLIRKVLTRSCPKYSLPHSKHWHHQLLKLGPFEDKCASEHKLHKIPSTHHWTVTFSPPLLPAQQKRCTT